MYYHFLIFNINNVLLGGRGKKKKRKKEKKRNLTVWNSSEKGDMFEFI